MPQPLGGAGQALQLPQYLYPSELRNAPYDIASNAQSLAPGDALPIPAGTWYLGGGQYSVLQIKDPVTGQFRIDRANASARYGQSFVRSDGYNYRLANLTGCAVSAVVTAAGSQYVESTTTVTANTGGSTWQAIVGGMLTCSSINGAGGGYGAVPLVLIPAPPSPGVQATAVATLTGGSVTAVTFTNVGAGYDTAPTGSILPNPTDPNFVAGSSITQATITISTFGGTSSSGTIAAIICTNNGTSVSAAPTLTIAGAGAGAAATANIMTTATGASIFAAGSMGTNAILTTVGGRPFATAANANPENDLSTFLPRQAQALLAAVGGSLVSVSTIYDGGLFIGTPNVLVTPQSGSTATVGASVVAILGAVTDTVWFQPC